MFLETITGDSLRFVDCSCNSAACVCSAGVGHILSVHKKYSARAKKREASQASSELGLNSNSNYESVEMIDGFYLFIGEMIA